MAGKSFDRSLDALAEVYQFAEALFEEHDVAADVRFPVHLALEELFTNMVKYNAGSGRDIDVDIDVKDGAVTVALIDHDVERFDVTRTRDVGVDAPLEERKPGGLGLHLVQHMVDSLQYEYRNRESRIRFTKEPGN